MQNLPEAKTIESLSIPDGFALAGDLGGHPCIVPTFLIPATHTVIEAYHTKATLDVTGRPGGVGSICRLMPVRSC